MSTDWKPEVLYMETVEGACAPSLTQHRCWNTTLFREDRITAAVQSTFNGKPVAVRFLSVGEYQTMGGR